MNRSRVDPGQENLRIIYALTLPNNSFFLRFLISDVPQFICLGIFVVLSSRSFHPVLGRVKYRVRPRRKIICSYSYIYLPGTTSDNVFNSIFDSAITVCIVLNVRLEISICLNLLKGFGSQ
jgi:hypothetical protein